MGSFKPEIPEGLDIDHYIINRFLPEKTNVLFLYPKNLTMIKLICDQKQLIPTIIDNDIPKLEKAYDIGFQNVIRGSINQDLHNIQTKSYDYCIVDEIIGKARFLQSFIKDITRISKYAILGHENASHWSKRLQFLMYGSLFVKSGFDFIADEEPWFEKSPWQLGHKDIMNLCRNSKILIKKGIYYTSAERINNIYDIKGYPGLYAKKVFYLLSDDLINKHSVEIISALTPAI